MIQQSRLYPKTALIIGAASGIGAAVAERFAAEGALIGLVDYRRNLLDETAARIEKLGHFVIPMFGDISKEESVNSFTQQMLTRLKRIDILVMCAGIITAGLVHETSLDDWNLLLATNLTGSFLCMRAVLPAMIAQGGGSIISIGSVSAHVIGAGGSSAAYEASKAALVQLTKAVSVEYAKSGIRANSISPGRIATRLGIHEKELTRDKYSSKRSAFRPVLKERLIEGGSAEEIAALAAFIASGESPFLTGANVVVDGGYSAF